MAECPRYHINVFWSPDDRCWVADVPDLRPCSAFGEDPAHALAEVLGAMVSWVDTAKAHDLPVPEPRYSPSICAARRAP